MSEFFLKCIALILMTIDHIGEFIPGSPLYFRWIGRLSAPIFIYMCVWYVYYTHDRKKYILRLYLFSVFMSLIQHLSLLNFPEKPLIDNNIFRTLFVLSVLLSISYEKKKAIYYMFFSIWQISGLALILNIIVFFPELGEKIGYILPAFLGNILDIEGKVDL